MNKHLLFLMLIPVLGLASCNGGGSAEFKKLSYLEVGGNVYHSEDGDLSSYYHVASYRLTDEDYAEAKIHCAPGVSLPQTFSLCSSSITSSFIFSSVTIISYLIFLTKAFKLATIYLYFILIGP